MCSATASPRHLSWARSAPCCVPAYWTSPAPARCSGGPTWPWSSCCHGFWQQLLQGQVGPPEHLAGAGDVQYAGTQQGADLAHDRCRGDAVAEHIADDKPYPVSVE